MQDFFSGPDVPDFYIDSVRIGVGPYGFTLDLGLTGLPDAPGSEAPPIKKIATLRMSPQHALVFARLLDKNVRIYQDKMGKIQLSADLFKNLGLDPE